MMNSRPISANTLLVAMGAGHRTAATMAKVLFQSPFSMIISHGPSGLVHDPSSMTDGPPAGASSALSRHLLRNR